MELRKNWFPLMLAAIWVVLSAAVILDFAKFNEATSAGAVASGHAAPHHGVAGRRALRPAAAIR